MQEINNIKEKLYELEEDINDLNILLSKNITIDNKIPEEEKILYIINTNQDIIKEITNFIIPLLKNN